MARLEEIAETTVWLCLDGASFATRVAMCVDGAVLAQQRGPRPANRPGVTTDMANAHQGAARCPYAKGKITFGMRCQIAPGLMAAAPTL
jgi:hypothetical protein